MDCSKLAINQKNNNVTISWHEVIIKVFDVTAFLLSCLVTGPNFIVTGSAVTTILIYKGLTRNPEIGNTPVWVLLNIWRLGQVRDTKSGTNVSNEKLLNAAKCHDYSFYRFWVIKGKSAGKGVKYLISVRTKLVPKYTLFGMGEGRGKCPPSYQFFPCNFNKREN